MKGPSYETKPELGELLSDAELCATFMTAECSAVAACAEGAPRRGYSDAVTVACRELRWRREVLDPETERHAEIGRLVEGLTQGRRLELWGNSAEHEASYAMAILVDHLNGPAEILAEAEADTLLDALRACAAELEAE